MPDTPPAPDRTAEVTATQPGGDPPTVGTSPLLAGRFVLRGEIARGGMGVVYAAGDPQFGREVAIKVMHERLVGSPSARRFDDESRITGQLQHPGIPAVYEAGRLPDGRPYLAMKLVKGRTLADLIASGAGDLLPAFEALCQAVGYAHSRRVIHRDLKPANVMVGAFGEVQVMDWGLAKVLGARQAVVTDPEATTDGGTRMTDPRADSDGSETQAGAMLGTPAFMPPEQAAGAIGEVDERADVFGLGAVLCVILTGKPPYAGGDGEEVRLMAIRAKLDDCHARLAASVADPELVALCKRCLAPEAAERPANAGEVAEAVAAIRRAADERARAAEVGAIRREEERKRRRVRVALMAAAFGLVAAAGFGVTVAVLWRSAEGAKRDAEAARERLAAVEYGRTMQVAYREYLDNNVGATLELLASTRPDLRGWEY